MNAREIEYLTLRRELVHYDTTCLTILGSLITASAAIYGVVLDPDRQPYGLLCGLDVMWLIGFLYIVDKRSSIIRIALYIKMRFEDSNKGGCSKDKGCYYAWEHWLDSSGKEINGVNSGLSDKGCTDTLPIIDPTRIEFFLLVLIGGVDTVCLRYAGNHGQGWWQFSLVLWLVSTVLGYWHLRKYLCFRDEKRNLRNQGGAIGGA